MIVAQFEQQAGKLSGSGSCLRIWEIIRRGVEMALMRKLFRLLLEVPALADQRLGDSLPTGADKPDLIASVEF